MVAVLRHKALDILRRVRPAMAAPDDDSAAMADESPGAFELVAQTQEAARVLRCLGSLEEGPRRSITLAYYDGLTQEEISRRLGTPLGTIKSWVRRGLLQLRGCLAEEGAHA